nr:hypothetical protein [Tanacetum cinerariifolium]
MYGLFYVSYILRSKLNMIQVALKPQIGHGYRQQECSINPFLIYNKGIKRVGSSSLEVQGAGSSDMDGAIRPRIDHGYQKVEEIMTERAFEEHEVLSEKIMEKLDALLKSLTHLHKEFSHMTELTKSYKYLESSKDGVLRNNYCLKVKLAWATLHSLLHSKRAPIRKNGYVWLEDLLIEEINDDGDSIWSNIKNLQKRITFAFVKDYSLELDIPLPVCLMCGLLKSTNNRIRWGFIFVLERLLMRCKFLLDESELRH